MKNQNTKNGFTLIELLVVISIIGVLTALLLSNFVGIRGRAKDAKLKGDLKQLKTALRLYYNDFQQYPADNANTIFGCGSGGTSACTTTFSVVTTTYMKELPTFDYYVQTDSGDGFYAGVKLNNASDKDIAKSASECGISSSDTSAFYVCAD